MTDNLRCDIEICRLCMNTSNLLNIFVQKEDNSIYNKINFCNVISVHEYDKLPKYVCNKCDDKLNDFYNFKLDCVSVDLKIKSLFHHKSKAKRENITKENLVCLDFNDEVEDFDNILATDSYELCEEKQDGVITQLKDFKAPETLDINKRLTERLKNKAKLAFQCEKCGKTFQTKGVLKKHNITHDNIKIHTCHLCHKMYTRKDYLTSHMKKHKGIKKYGCEQCSKKFFTKQDLIRHEKIHSDERNYSCERCEKKFKRSFDIISHMRVHTGHRPFVCKKCPKAYKSHSGLKKHTKQHIGVGNHLADPRN